MLIDQFFFDQRCIEHADIQRIDIKLRNSRLLSEQLRNERGGQGPAFDNMGDERKFGSRRFLLQS